MDTELVKAAQRGDEEAFATLVVAYGGRLQAVAYRILRDFNLAEDATQQALIRIWKGLPKLKDPTSFEAWSYQLLVRACYAEARRARYWSPGPFIPNHRIDLDGTGPGIRELMVWFEPILPDGTITCSACG